MGPALSHCALHDLLCLGRHQSHALFYAFLAPLASRKLGFAC